jgi:ABC-type lipoprotein export system ATPase subunit
MLVQARDLCKDYRRGQERVEALRSIDFELSAGDFAVIVGPSGGGKSTLLHLLGGMDRPTHGTLCVCGVNLDSASEEALNRFRREHVGFIFQFYNLIPSLNAAENVALPLLAQGARRAEANRRALEVLDQVGIDHRMRHKPAELSGGEQQRVAIARAIAGGAGLVLADEPTGDLDAASAERIMQLMADLNRRSGITFIVATHNPGFSRFASQLYDLVDGQLSRRDKV